MHQLLFSSLFPKYTCKENNSNIKLLQQHKWISLSITTVRDPSLTSAKNCLWLTRKYCAELSTSLPQRFVCYSSSICHTHHPLFQIRFWKSEDKTIQAYCQNFPHPHASFGYLLLISLFLFIYYMKLVLNLTETMAGLSPRIALP